MIHEVVHRLVAFAHYLFHLCSRNECLRGEEMEELEVARKYLELGITSDAVAHPEIVEIGFERESLSPR